MMLLEALGNPILNIVIFGVFVVATLTVVIKVTSNQNKAAGSFYTGGAQFSGTQNGFAIAGDYLSAASFLGIAGAIALQGYDGFLYSIGFLVAWLVALLLVAELLRNTGRFTMADVLSFRLKQHPVRLAAATSTLTVSLFYLLAQMAGAGGLVALLLDVKSRGGQSIVIAVVGVLMIVYVLVGGMKAKERRIALSAIADGRAGLVVGTHAVLTDTVEFKNLGLAIVDEQHRFGVRQRGLLAGKAQSPHLLVMSATPIPRTLGLLMYGDLDISVLDELPPGRKPIKTWFITGKKRRDMYGFLDKQIAAGHQVYIVCPAIEENEAMGDLQAVTTYYTETACALLPNRRIGLLHGKLKPKEKDDVMQRFKAGELDVLVSTTVIEVGVDVPNATVMVIENAERFGLSALHQLRGRVGRGAADSCCILISDNGNDAVRERLQFLCRTSDGFAVAKYDLETRGPGDFFGSAQHGLPTLRVADLVQDTRTLRVAQDEAKALLAKDPNLIDPAHRALSDEVERLFETAGAMN